MNFGGQSRQRVACICINKCDKAALGTPKMRNARRKMLFAYFLLLLVLLLLLLLLLLQLELELQQVK